MRVDSLYGGGKPKTLHPKRGKDVGESGRGERGTVRMTRNGPGYFLRVRKGFYDRVQSKGGDVCGRTLRVGKV